MKKIYTTIALGLLSVASFSQVTSFPYTENFEGETQGSVSCGGAYTLNATGWLNSTTDGIDWTADIGGTSSSSTGPSNDHTTGTTTGFYLYLESSSCYSQTASLLSPEFDLTSVGAALGADMSFWFHMYGSTQGTIDVDITTDGGTTWTTLSSFTDDLDDWQEYTYDVSTYIGYTVQFRITGTTGTSYYSDMAIDDFSLTLSFADDIGITSISEPSNGFSPGSINTQASFTNYGTTTITSAQINWSVDGVLQTPYTFTGSVASGQNSGIINLGFYSYPAGTSDICVWTSLPNGNTDPFTPNDTLCESKCSGIAGTYYIGGTTPDYATFAEVVDVLTTCGISGPTEFIVAAGTYDEAVQLTQVVGSSATNTVTFTGEDVATTFITHDGSTSNAVISMIGTEYVKFQNFTISHSGTSDSWGVFLSESAGYDTIQNCIINMEVGNYTDVASICISADITNDYSEGDNANYCVFDNNEFNGGEVGIAMEGESTFADWMTGIEITNNTFTDFYDYAVYADNQSQLTISGNTLNSSTADGLYLLDIVDFTIELNSIYVADYGLYIADGNFTDDGAASGTSSITNNMISSSTYYGVYLDDVEQVNFWHNTVSCPVDYYALRVNDFLDSDVRNNIFYSMNDYAFYSTDDLVSSNTTVDYNIYYTEGSYFVYEAGGYTNLVAWQAAQPTLNVNSFETDPIFYDNTTDLHVFAPTINDLGDNSIGVSIDIDGETRPMGTNVDIGADEFNSLSNDALLETIVSPSATDCGDANYEVKVVLGNHGNTIFTCPVVVEITGDYTQTFNATYNNTLLFNETDTLVVGTFDTYNGGNINVLAYTNYPSDQDLSNDTLSTTATLIPFEPQGGSYASCGADSALLYADTTYSATYEWYDAASGGNLVGSGDYYTVNSISTQDTYYLQYVQGNADSLITTYAAGNQCSGGAMFDVNTPTGTTISGFRVGSTTTSGATTTVTVHYIYDTHIGNETNSTAWTTEGTYTITSGGAGAPSTRFDLATPIIIPAGQVVGIYLEYTASYTTSVSTDYVTGDITVTAGTGLCSSFGGTNYPRIFNGTIYFSGESCSDIRTPIQALDTAPAAVNLGEDTVACTPNGAVVLDPGTNLTDYLWAPSGSTDSTYTTSSNGEYIVTATDLNGCTESDTILVIFQECLSADNYTGISEVNVFPNPNNGQFELQVYSDLGIEIYEIRITALDGKIMYQNTLNQNGGYYTESIDLNNRSKGVYLINILTSEGNEVHRVIVQ